MAWIARLGQILWTLIEVASADGIRGRLKKLFFTSLYLFEGLVIVGSWLLGIEEGSQLGWGALVITGALHLLILIVGDLIADRKKWRYRAVWVLIAVGVVFALIGIDAVVGSGVYAAITNFFCWVAQSVQSLF